MPIAVYNGVKRQIPFDPGKIAEMIYQGVEIYPDEGISENRAKWEKDLIETHMRKLWGSKNTRTKQGRAVFNGSPAIREDSDFTDRLPPQGRQEMDYMNVEPNPYVKRPIGEVDPLKLPAYLERIKKIPRTAYGWGLGQSVASLTPEHLETAQSLGLSTLDQLAAYARALDIMNKKKQTV